MKFASKNVAHRHLVSKQPDTLSMALANATFRKIKPSPQIARAVILQSKEYICELLSK